MIMVVGYNNNIYSEIKKKNYEKRSGNYIDQADDIRNRFWILEAQFKLAFSLLHHPSWLSFSLLNWQ